ncbi:oxygen-independent coproporphyrinogen-3 oxidase [Parapedobacter composti]|uniref:Heme chaperone HemW n=1 Tax=Parapedobacter composti TaxID=623281 RepID=A0A1I1JCI5_9SPHI|nr:radical SAM family heme chaperone HemW [Parapedobacter composti]SFC46254.1 oxygen-independent coproporphyrinogen-3 oxidase [Parapedobacter composti]
MAGVYFHIPFCKQACHYCDFHFSTSLSYREGMMQALLKETAMRVAYLGGEPVESIYFGGGTPSVLAADDIQRLVDGVTSRFDVTPGAEVTLEANPDDLNAAKVDALKSTPVNRFSIGVQSFFDDDLRWMNRAHRAEEAAAAIKRVQDAGFTNITVDLIYGYPLLTDEKWHWNIQQLLAYSIPHISAYSMTVEPRTALASFIEKNKQEPMDDEHSATQFEHLMDVLEMAGYEHYELSNFAKPGCYAVHNSNYWRGRLYLGIGPSAHSYDGSSRQWNVRNNARYIRALQAGTLPYEREVLTEENRLNEYIMTALRTAWGVDLDHVAERFGRARAGALRLALQPFVSNGDVILTDAVVTLSRKGKLMADHIAAELFVG